MNLVKSAFTISVILSLAACQSSSYFIGDEKSDDATKLAVVTSYASDGGHVYFTTVSNGCTFIDSFKLEVDHAGQNRIKIIQVKPDLCRMEKRTISLQYSYKHLGLNPQQAVVLANPLQVSGP
jgi:hypothetical protein